MSEFVQVKEWRLLEPVIIRTRGSSKYKYVVFPIPGVFILRRGPGLIGNIGFIYSHPTPTPHKTKQNKNKIFLSPFQHWVNDTNVDILAV